MPVHNYPGPTMNRLQTYPFTFIVTDRNGNPDLTSSVTLSSTAPGVATVAIDPNNNRRAIVTGVGPGGTTISVTKTGAASSLTISQTVADIDLSGCDLNPPDSSAMGPVTGPS